MRRLISHFEAHSAIENHHHQPGPPARSPAGKAGRFDYRHGDHAEAKEIERNFLGYCLFNIRRTKFLLAAASRFRLHWRKLLTVHNPDD
jgi:hypothetical protein